jgi:hypothetical protein
MNLIYCGDIEGRIVGVLTGVLRDAERIADKFRYYLEFGCETTGVLLMEGNASKKEFYLDV